MKVNKKKNKRKPSSHSYRKWGSSGIHSNSLSDLLLIGSFKKRIADLSRNNSLLTNALQESIVESAHQNKLLRNYAKDYNQILFARIKLNDMARNLAKFATDLEEVRDCLAIELPAECNFFQEKKISNERIVKVPDVSCIDEAPELSEDELEASENADIRYSNEAENIAPVIHDVHMTPPLYDGDDDDEGIQKKKSSAVFKGSLTPQLDIDLTFVNSKRSTRSKRKTSSLGKKKSSGRLISQKNSVSSPLLLQEQNSSRISIASRISSKNLSSVCAIEENFDDVEVPLQNPSNNFIDCNKDYSIIPPSDLNTKDEKSVLKDDLNLSSEIDEEVCPLQALNEEYNASFDANLANESENNKSIEQINENSGELSPDKNKLCIERNSKKLSIISRKASSSHSGKHEFDDEILNVGSLTFCESDDEIQNVGSLTFCESDDEDDGGKINRVSSLIRTSRSKKPLSYAGFFSSDESDIDLPFKPAVTKRKSSKKVKLYSHSNGNSGEELITENAVEISSDLVAGILEPDYSVYNLDVSDSQRKGKKSRKKTSSMKSKSKKNSDAPKPLFSKCSVTKLKGGEHKFSKSCETPLELKSIGKHAQKLMQNSCASPSGILKKSSISKTCEDKKNETPPSDSENIKDLQNLKHQSMFQTPKRVSFAPTDLVCNFEKMSVSKKIADNKKVRRTSKSAADLEKLFDEAQLNTSPIKTELFAEDRLNASGIGTELLDEDRLKSSPIDTKLLDEDISKMPPTDTDIPLRKKDIQESNNSIVFDFGADTEMYTLSFPLNMQSLPVGNGASSKPFSSLPSEQTEPISNIKEMDSEKSPETLPKSPKNIKKLSLKENKIIRNLASQESLDKAEMKAAILFMESPVSFLKQPKRKSLFKELPDDDLKENINFDHQISEKKDLLKNDIEANECSSLSTLTVGIKKSSNSKSKITVRSKTSTKKTKKNNLEKKSLEQSPVLIDATNVIDLTEEKHSRRRSKQVSYKEPSLTKKLRRE